MDEESKTFVVYVAAIKAWPRSARITMHSSRDAQIAAFKLNEASTKVPSKYADYTDAFSFNLVIELLENTAINKHAIQLHDGKQPPYKPMYSLGPVELETLKTYIETHLKTRFIQPFKSPANAPILFDKKLDGSFWLFVNY